MALELLCMGVGAWGLVTQNLGLLLVALFLGGVQSTLFGPVKYAILPQVLNDRELVGGNALVETGTSIAILIGMIVGGWMIAQPNWGIVGVGITTMSFSALGIILSRAIPTAPAVDPGLRINWNPITETWRNYQFTRENRVVFLSILGISWFWFYGAMLATQFPNLSKNVLHGNEHVVTLLLIIFSVGVGVGSLLCERLSGHKVEIGLVPFGSIGLSVFGIDLWAATAGYTPLAAGITPAAFLNDAALVRIAADLLLIGVFGGFYIVPLYALIQSRGAKSHRSRIIAGNNILNAAFIVAAAVLAIVLLNAGATIPQIILVTAVLNAAVAFYIYALVPEFLMRFVLWILIHSVYRLNKTGLERIPEEGAAIVVCNHTSYVDALVISAACQRPIRWVTDHSIFKVPVLSFFFRSAKAIPIASAKEDPAMLERAYDAIARELANGQIVGIFPEGKLTLTGEMNEFRGGVMRILEKSPVPVIPMALSGLWQSLFARNRDKLRHATKLFPKIRLAVGEPLPAAQVTPQVLQTVVLELRGESQ